MKWIIKRERMNSVNYERNKERSNSVDVFTHAII